VSDFKIVDNRPAGERSGAAHAALDRAVERDPRMAGADADAYMALADHVAELQARGDFKPAGHLRPGKTFNENKRVSAVPGRPDLQFIRGNGFDGCTYVVVSRVKPQPARVQVRSWAEDEDTETAQQTQTVSVIRFR
jgi:hypothetical protein